MARRSNPGRVPEGWLILRDGAVRFERAGHLWYAECQEPLEAKARYLIGRCSGQHTLAGHALINTAVELLLERDRKAPILVNDAGHYRALVARTMFRVFVDDAKAKKAKKHGGDRHRTQLTTSFPLGGKDVVPLLDFWMLVERLEPLNELHALLVVLRMLGYSLAEMSLMLGIPRTSLQSEFNKAKAWLNRRLERGYAA